MSDRARDTPAGLTLEKAIMVVLGIHDKTVFAVLDDREVPGHYLIYGSEHICGIRCVSDAWTWIRLPADPQEVPCANGFPPRPATRADTRRPTVGVGAPYRGSVLGGLVQRSDS